MGEEKAMVRRMMGAAAIVLAAAMPALAGNGGKIAWGTDWNKALAEAKKTGRPLMVYFTADW